MASKTARKYPVEAGWFFSPGRGSGYTNNVGPSPLGDACGHPLADAVLGFDLTGHRPTLEISAICQKKGSYSNPEDLEETIVFDAKAYSLWELWQRWLGGDVLALQTMQDDLRELGFELVIVASKK